MEFSKCYNKVCGMIRFSPDCRCLYSLVFNKVQCKLFRFDVNMENDGTFSLAALTDQVSYQPREIESCSETGFLLGDPFCLPSESRRPRLAFLLSKQSVLRASSCGLFVEMLCLDKLTVPVSSMHVEKVAFSVNADTVYVVPETRDDNQATLMAWDIPNNLEAQKRHFKRILKLVAVREGVLLQTSHDTLELWNFDLSECIRSWTDLGDIKKVIPISEERVACTEENWFRFEEPGLHLTTITILDTTGKNTVTRITSDWHFVACNSKCHVITSDDVEKLQMECGNDVLWKTSMPHHFSSVEFKAFSPTEECCVIAGIDHVYLLDDTVAQFETIYLLDAVSGETLHMLCQTTYSDWTFVSEEECVANCYDESSSYLLRLFNIKSGDLLSEIAVESRVYSLAARRRDLLMVMGLSDSKVVIKVFQVKLPRDRDSGESKRSGDIKKCSGFS